MKIEENAVSCRIKIKKKMKTKKMIMWKIRKFEIYLKYKLLFIILNIKNIFSKLFFKYFFYIFNKLFVITIKIIYN